MKQLIVLFGLLLSLHSMADAETLRITIPHPYYVNQPRSINQVMLLDNGLAALQMRLDIINRAEKNVEVEYFIYKADKSGKLITLALQDAARRGVKVRILVDKAINLAELTKWHSREFLKLGIELKYYNDVPFILPMSAQFRDHRKLISVDDKEAITGGRNIGDDYFHMSEEFNFNDRDVYVKGPIVAAMRESFDQYFYHKITTPTDELKTPKKPGEKYLRKYNETIDFLNETEESVAVRARVEELARPILNASKLHICPDATFATDAPGLRSDLPLKKEKLKKFRFLREAIFDRIRNTSKSLIVSSPYMINNHATLDLMEETISRGVDVRIYTNSLASTDALYMVANTYLKIMLWSQFGVKTWLHNGKPYLNDVIFDQKAATAKWGSHDKTQIYESETFSEVMIGSYNIDNRSYHFNTELAFFCRGSDEFTKEVKDSVVSRSEQGFLFMPDGTATNKAGEKVNVYGAPKKQVILMKALALPSWFIRYFL